ncbi:MAG: zf-HC2 domain-containing protein [Candidatus Eremiobacteraeota bacterium]|nr:zf-HC2 domain-containing protein [Candidatus Eremiobacteraeota bacterium]
MNNEHDFEALDLYALGTLDEGRAADVDRHVSECAVCAKRLGEAEQTVTALLERQYAPQRGIKFWMPAAVAAALLLWLVPLGLLGNEVRTLHTAQIADATAVSALVHSHFLHVPFKSITNDAPRAKVLYGRSDPWLYVVADNGEGLEVAVSGAGQPRPQVVGTLRKVGEESSLFARASHVREVVLLRNGVPIARATLLGKND